MTRRFMTRRFMRAVAVAAMLASGGPAFAADFPSRPVRLLVPYAPGGGLDIVARSLGEPLARMWGQQLIIDNRPGAGGIIASTALVQSPPDGYTLMIVASGHPVNQFLYPRLPYDTFKDFTAITEIGGTPNVVLVNKDFPAKTLPDLIALARAKPGALSYGVPGIGTSGHLAGELLKHMAKIDMVPIPYKGGAPILTALMAGEIPLSVSVLTEAMGQIQSGSVRVLAVTTAQRSPVLPDVPTVAEAGLPGYDTSVWWGLLGPAGMAPDLVDKLYKDFTAAVRDPAVQERIKSLGGTLSGTMPQEFEASMRAQAAKWEPIIRAAKIGTQ
jgi:tripartite-type tricarboxylate transporter receptor subunit TctC